jgi:hypothetical protein
MIANRRDCGEGNRVIATEQAPKIVPLRHTGVVEVVARKLWLVLLEEPVDEVNSLNNASFVTHRTKRGRQRVCRDSVGDAKGTNDAHHQLGPRRSHANPLHAPCSPTLSGMIASTMALAGPMLAYGLEPSLPESRRGSTATHQLLLCQADGILPVQSRDRSRQTDIADI